MSLFSRKSNFFISNSMNIAKYLKKSNLSITRKTNFSKLSQTLHSTNLTRISTNNLPLNLKSNCIKTLNIFIPKRGLASMTDGDKDLISLISEEIHYEEDNVLPIPDFHDFQYSMKDTIVTLKKNFNKEKVVVTFDVNENLNVDEDGVMNEDEVNDDQLNSPDITSYPSFTVKIIKPSGNTLVFDCSFNTQMNEEDDGDDEGAIELFKFDNVSVCKEGELSTAYEAETETLDGEMYSLLMNLLLERGITGAFANDLLDLSTAVEHRHYLKFLKSLQKYLNEK